MGDRGVMWAMVYCCGVFVIFNSHTLRIGGSGLLGWLGRALAIWFCSSHGRVVSRYFEFCLCCVERFLFVECLRDKNSGFLLCAGVAGVGAVGATSLKIPVLPLCSVLRL